MTPAAKHPPAKAQTKAPETKADAPEQLVKEPQQPGPTPNMAVEIPIDGEGLGNSPMGPPNNPSPATAFTQVHAKGNANAALGRVNGPEGGGQLFIFVSGAEPGSTVTVAYYTPPE